MKSKLLAILLLLAVTVGSAFRCTPDSILQWGAEKRAKQLERECHLAKNVTAECPTEDAVEQAWKEFMDVSLKYQEAVKDCRKARDTKKSVKALKKRSTDDGYADDVEENKTSGDCEGPCTIDMDEDRRVKRAANGHSVAKRECGCKLKLKELLKKAAVKDISVSEESSADKLIKSESDEEPELKKRDVYTKGEHHQNHPHSTSRHQPDDPQDDMREDHSKHGGHRHRRHSHIIRREEDQDFIQGSENKKGELKELKRTKRQSCMMKGQDELTSIGDKFKDHCNRYNICLPDEDLTGEAALNFKALHKLRAKKYSNYASQLHVCYGKLQ